MATAEISAKEVFKLRKQTGAGMMDCKKALIESDGDFDAAIDYLRKKGQKLANKRADREASEGYALAKVSGKRGYLLVLNCETDFVAKNADFGKLVESLIDVAIENDSKNLEELLSATIEGITVSEKIVEQTGVIGEKLELSYYEVVEGVVSEVNEFGAFVRIGPMEALLHKSQIMDDTVDANVGMGWIEGKQTGRRLQIGDSIRARIVSLSPDTSDPRRSKIGLTSKQPGLGCHAWIDEDNNE